MNREALERETFHGCLLDRASGAELRFATLDEVCYAEHLRRLGMPTGMGARIDGELVLCDVALAPQMKHLSDSEIRAGAFPLPRRCS